MSYSVAANTRVVGDPKGIFRDDLTDPAVGEWPRTLAIKKITKISVFGGAIVDSIRTTYALDNSPTPMEVVSLHGGLGGVEILNFSIGATEKLIAVYGAQLLQPTIFGNHNIVRLSFVVADSSGVVPTVKVYNAAATSQDPFEKFDFTWAVAGASSYTFKQQGALNGYLQALGFSEVLDQASP